MGKKKFIDKKKAATFHLFARDYSEIESQETDHVFVRVDTNPVTIDGFLEGLADDKGSLFADDSKDDSFTAETGPLPDQLRREMLELGFPDDGYDYSCHMREIRWGGGSDYYLNSKLKLDRVPIDVKAYDFSEVGVKSADVEVNEESMMYSVAEKSLSVGVQAAVDPEVTAFLEDVDSQLGSDVEDLEDDFVVQANLSEEEDLSEDCPGEVKDRIDEKPKHLVF